MNDEQAVTDLPTTREAVLKAVAEALKGERGA